MQLAADTVTVVCGGLLHTEQTGVARPHVQQKGKKKTLLLHQLQQWGRLSFPLKLSFTTRCSQSKQNLRVC